MIEKIQFWAVLLWMIGMLVMAGFAVRAVWLESDRTADESGAEDHHRDGASAKGNDPGDPVAPNPRSP